MFTQNSIAHSNNFGFFSICNNVTDLALDKNIRRNKHRLEHPYLAGGKFCSRRRKQKFRALFYFSIENAYMRDNSAMNGILIIENQGPDSATPLNTRCFLRFETGCFPAWRRDFRNNFLQQPLYSLSCFSGNSQYFFFTDSE